MNLVEIIVELFMFDLLCCRFVTVVTILYTASVNVEFDASRELNHNSIDSTLTTHNYHFVLQHLCLSCEHELGFI